MDSELNTEKLLGQLLAWRDDVFETAGLVPPNTPVYSLLFAITEAIEALEVMAHGALVSILRMARYLIDAYLQEEQRWNRSNPERHNMSYEEALWGLSALTHLIADGMIDQTPIVAKDGIDNAELAKELGQSLLMLVDATRFLKGQGNPLEEVNTWAAKRAKTSVKKEE